MAANNNTDELEIIVVEPKHRANAAIIWLHGLGASGSDFIPITKQIGLPEAHDIRFLFPNAPARPITVNHQMVMPGWYDIFGLDLTAKEDIAGIQHSTKILNNLIQQEINNGILSSNILLAGFSQGAAMALHTGLCYPQKLGGIIALSGYMPLILGEMGKSIVVQQRGQINPYDNHHKILNPANANIPIFMAHGLFDTVVPFHVGKNSYEYLTHLTYNVQWQTYPMLHTLCLEEIHDIGIFVRKVLTINAL